VRETVNVVERLVDKEDGDWISLAPIAQALKLDKSAASRRVRTAISKGLLKNLEDRRGKPGKYTIGDPMPDDLVVLPPAEEVLQALQCCSVVGGDRHSPSPSEEWGEI